VSLADLASILRAEPAYQISAAALPWQRSAAALLAGQREREAQHLATPLAILFASPDA
jgi:hypothetical protein